jgi:hypothetical protein
MPECTSFIRPLSVSGKGEKRSGEKDLERQPLTVWIQSRQLYKDIRF